MNVAIEHDLEASQPGIQTFWMELTGDDVVWVNAQLRAWLAIGHDDFGTYEELTSYMKGKWKLALRQAMQVEAMRCAYKVDEVKWLVKNDADFEIYPFAEHWNPILEPADMKVILTGCDDLAMLFKLTFGGNA